MQLTNAVDDRIGGVFQCCMRCMCDIGFVSAYQTRELELQQQLKQMTRERDEVNDSITK